MLRNLMNNVTTMALPCTSESLRIYNLVKDKLINESKIQLVSNTYNPLDKIGKWYRIGTEESSILVFRDTRDKIYNYQIFIFLHGNGNIDTSCCNSNPLVDCTCGLVSTCITSVVTDKKDNLLLENTIPDKVLNASINII